MDISKVPSDGILHAIVAQFSTRIACCSVLWIIHRWVILEILL